MSGALLTLALLMAPASEAVAGPPGAEVIVPIVATSPTAEAVAGPAVGKGGAAHAVVEQPVRTASSQFVPDTVLRPPGGPDIAFVHAGSAGTVSIRVSFPLQEAPSEAGAGQLLRIQGQDRMDNIASRIGARAEVHRTPAAIVYQVEGAAQDLDFLAWILREGMAPPEERRFEPARREIRVDLERRLETPEGTLAIRLHGALVPGAPPLQGSLGALDRMNAGHLSAIWARSHQRSEAKVVVVGRVEPAVLLAALSDLGLPEQGPTPQIPVSEPTGEPRGAPEVIRHWTGRAYPIEAHEGPRALIAAHLLGALLREVPGDYESSVELWEMGAGRALVLSGAAYDRGRQAMTSRIEGLTEEGIGHITEEEVAAISARLRMDLRLSGRSPWGFANLVGQAWDAGLGPAGTEELLRELERTDATDVRLFLEALGERTPVVEELRP